MAHPLLLRRINQIVDAAVCVKETLADLHLEMEIAERIKKLDPVVQGSLDTLTDLSLSRG